MPSEHVDAVVVGAGPNGLAAAIHLAQAGYRVLVREAEAEVGGGARTAALTLPGFRHDVCSAIYPLGAASPFFNSIPLAKYGLEWVHSPAPLAHPLDDGSAVLLERSLDATAAGLGRDAAAYHRLMRPLVATWDAMLADVLAPLQMPPRHPLALMRFGLRAIWPATVLARALFQGPRARALFAGLAAHSILPLERPITSGVALMLGTLGHAVGWPMARGGAQRVADALAAHLRALGGQIVTSAPVDSLDELPAAKVTLLDVTPRQLLRLAGERLPAGYRRQLGRYRYGPGAYKVDYALDGPIPWAAAECARAGTVHLGGTLEEVAAGERAVWRGVHPEQPFVLLAQPSVFDATRAPEGKHVAWAYCHVPNGSSVDMTARIEAQIERFASGFRARILARSVRTPGDLERSNANYVGGDIAGGVQDLGQHFTRPVARWVPYSTPVRGLYLCSSSTPPGGGVHGLCGYFAARAAMRQGRG